MGKVSGAEMKKKKKKGRPSLSDLRMRNNPSGGDSTTRRSTRRNPNSAATDSDSDDDERKEKKLKLVERLPTSNSTSLSSGSPEIDASAARSAVADDDVVVRAEKVTETLQGSPLESGPTAPLPDKKFLVFILDRLQKKDTYGVFSEPVDTDELPDYLEIIEHPMDFGTVRKKLDEESYSNLDDFESDVLLICANAMQYNAPDTVYYRQAKSIQDIAKRDFQNLRQVNDEGEPQPKIVRRGRPPNSLKKTLSSPPLERVALESSPIATLATAGDNNNSNINNNDNDTDNNAVGSSSYNLRKGVPLFRFQTTDSFFRESPQSRNTDTYRDYTTDWNSEFPASVMKAEAKHTKKQFSSDETRRSTYKLFHPTAFGRDPSSLTTLNRNMKHLIGVGLHTDHGYARSLARFAANLGPVVWKIASKKIEKALPKGANFGPGWIGENDQIPPQTQPSVLPLNSLIHDNNSTHLQSGPSSSEALDQSNLINNISRTGAILEAQQRHLLHNRNELNNISSFDFSTQAEILRARLNLPTQFGSLEAQPSAPSLSPPDTNMGVSSSKIPHNIAPASQQHRPYNNIIPVPVPPDLNVRFQGPNSPNSAFRIGEPQPDLALQL